MALGQLPRYLGREGRCQLLAAGQVDYVTRMIKAEQEGLFSAIPPLITQLMPSTNARNVNMPKTSHLAAAVSAVLFVTAAAHGVPNSTIGEMLASKT